jgi:hypothetical protein
MAPAAPNKVRRLVAGRAWSDGVVIAISVAQLVIAVLSEIASIVDAFAPDRAMDSAILPKS